MLHRVPALFPPWNQSYKKNVKEPHKEAKSCRLTETKETEVIYLYEMCIIGYNSDNKTSIECILNMWWEQIFKAKSLCQKHKYKYWIFFPPLRFISRVIPLGNRENYSVMSTTEPPSVFFLPDSRCSTEHVGFTVCVCVCVCVCVLSTCLHHWTHCNSREESVISHQALRRAQPRKIDDTLRKKQKICRLREPGLMRPDRLVS